MKVNPLDPKAEVTVALRTLSDLLWHERDLLESLQYRLEVEQLLLEAGRTTRLPIAAGEVDDALAQIRTAELARAAELATVTAALGLSDGASLRDIAEAAPAPWDGIYREHRTALLSLTTEISGVAAANREVLATAHHATQETLMSLHESVETYDAHGATPRDTATPRMIDESL